MFIVKRAEFQSHTAPKSKKRTWTEYVGVLVLCCIEWYTIKYNDQAFCYWDVLSKWCLSQKHWVVLVHDFFGWRWIENTPCATGIVVLSWALKNDCTVHVDLEKSLRKGSIFLYEPWLTDRIFLFAHLPAAHLCMLYADSCLACF